MGRSHEAKREARKVPRKTLKQRRSERRLKDTDQKHGSVHVE
jgi:hypothetical protein